MLAGVEELAQRSRAQGGRAAAAQRREQGAVAGDAPDRRVADGAAGLLLVDPPGYAGERVGTHGGGGAWCRVLALRLLGGAARKCRRRKHQNGERYAQHAASFARPA